jgi:hypothetical protein
MTGKSTKTALRKRKRKPKKKNAVVRQERADAELVASSLQQAPMQEEADAVTGEEEFSRQPTSREVSLARNLAHNCRWLPHAAVALVGCDFGVWCGGGVCVCVWAGSNSYHLIALLVRDSTL